MRSWIVLALFVSLGGTSMAAVSYATRAGSVDGKSAVYSGASLSQSAGKLVATERSGADKGRLPGRFVADVPKTRSGKIMRRLLKDIAEGKALGDTTTLADPGVVARLKADYEEGG